MIILNSVNDFKSLFVKVLLEYKELTYVNLEYTENNNIEYDSNSTSVVFIDSPVNDSERMITKKMDRILKYEEKNKTRENNIYISSNIKSYPFDEIRMKPLKPYDDFEELNHLRNPNSKELVITEPYIILRFLEDLCDTPSLYPTAIDKRYTLHQFEKMFIRDIFNMMYDFERLLILCYGNNCYNLKKIMFSNENILKNNHVKGKFNKIMELVNSKILPFVIQKEEKKYFMGDKINSIEIIIYSMIKKLFDYKLIERYSLNKIMIKKYDVLYNLFNKNNEDKEYQVVNYRNTKLSHHIK